MGYLYELRIAAQVDLLELGYFAGFGEKNSSLGMACVEVVGQSHQNGIEMRKQRECFGLEIGVL